MWRKNIHITKESQSFKLKKLMATREIPTKIIGKNLFSPSLQNSEIKGLLQPLLFSGSGLVKWWQILPPGQSTCSNKWNTGLSPTERDSLIWFGKKSAYPYLVAKRELVVDVISCPSKIQAPFHCIESSSRKGWQVKHYISQCSRCFASIWVNVTNYWSIQCQ